MRISLNWLKEYIPLHLEHHDLAHRLTMIGLEVEAITANPMGIQGIMVGEIVNIKNHPNAAKLKICTVNIGRESLSVVCGASNVEKGFLVPVAGIGSVLSDGQEIAPVTIRGIPSEGMLCSEKELGLSEDHSGIYILDKKRYTVGTLFQNSHKDEDVIFDINVTPNRPDCLSFIGIAREIGVLLEREIIVPDSTVKETKMTIELLAAVEIRDSQACPRYCARVIQDVRIGPSPEWLKNRLESVGVRSINNVVDITNFVLMETGQPLHAFDYDLIQNHKIVVRKAQEKEKFVTLDEKTYILSSEDLLICDGERGVALAGIMGGLNSEVTKHTRHIFLESAYFDPPTIRKSVKRFGIITEASQRFERGVDPNNLIFALNRAAQLLSEIASGKVVRGIIDIYPKPLASWRVLLRLNRIAHILGTEIPQETVILILTRLGLKIQGEDPLEVTVPTSRYDLKNEIDLIEEIVRHYGFDKIEPKMVSNIVLNGRVNEEQKFVEKVRDIFVGIGFHETLNNSLVSEKHISSFTPDIKPVILQNPLSPENAFLRTTLLPGILDSLQWNLNRSITNLRLFEIGKTFESQKNSLPKESLRLGGVLSGSVRSKPFWGEKSHQTTFFHAKGIIETVMQKLHINSVTFMKSIMQGFTSDVFVHIIIDKTIIGYIGRLDLSSLNNWDITEETFGFEIFFNRMMQYMPNTIKCQPISRFPAVRRDLAFVVDASIAVEELKNGISEYGGKDLVSTEVFDLYQGKQIPNGKKSIAFSLTFLSPEKTLKEEEVESVISAIIKSIEKKFHAKLRS